MPLFQFFTYPERYQKLKEVLGGDKVKVLKESSEETQLVFIAVELTNGVDALLLFQAGIELGLDTMKGSISSQT
jgi:hypothetical protein